MSKRKSVMEDIQSHNTNPADAAMYEGGTLDDDFFAGLNDSGAVYRENEELRQQVETLRQQINELEQSSTALSKSGQLQIGRFTMKPTGLAFPSDISQEELAEVGQLLFRLEGAIQWLIGDWLVHVGQYTWGEIDQLAAHFGRSTKTLYDCKYVARNVQISVRTEILSFTHHALVAKMDEDQQRHWLERAAQGETAPDGTSIPWTVAQLRAAIREAEGQTKALPPGQQIIRKMTKSAKSIAQILASDSLRLSKRKREQRLKEIERMRRLLDEAEQKLRDQE